MIARQWIGETLESDADIYSKYLEDTGISEIRAMRTPGTIRCRRFGSSIVLIGEDWKIWRVDFTPAFRLHKDLKDPRT